MKVDTPAQGQAKDGPTADRYVRDASHALARMLAEQWREDALRAEPVARVH